MIVDKRYKRPNRQFIKENYQRMTDREMARAFGVGIQAVQTMRRRMGIKRVLVDSIIGECQ